MYMLFNYFLLDIMPKANSLSGLTHEFGSSTYPAVHLLIWALAGIFGIIGGLRIYALWNVSGRAHIHIDAEVVGWMAACIFLVIANIFIGVIFNV